MEYLSPFGIGFIAAFLGLIAPSMLNMTAAKTSLEKGRANGIKFAAGAATMVIVQAFVAVYFAEKITPDIITKLQTAAIFVLVALAFFFYKQAKKEFKAEGKDKEGSSYIIGLGMSSLNMLAVPFYLVAAKGSGMSLVAPFQYIFVAGAAMGAFTIFTIYASFAEVIAKKAQFIAKNINYILAVLFIVLAIVNALKVFEII